MDPFCSLLSELAGVDEVIAMRLADLDLDTVTAGALSHASGKRIRARFLIHSTQAVLSDTPEEAARLAAAVEMIHLASPIHDDIIDVAETRRDRASARSVLGVDAALALGGRAVRGMVDCRVPDGAPRDRRGVSKWRMWQ